MDVLIRDATGADLEALVALRIEYLKVHYAALSMGDIETISAQVKDYICREIGKSFFAAVAENKGKYISSAFLAVSQRPANLSYLNGKIGTILNVFTFPEYRNKGIATEVVEKMISRGRQLELSFLELSATPAGKSLYKKLGFIEKEHLYTEMRLVL